MNPSPVSFGPAAGSPSSARGFSLIELLTVIAIIGILAAILIPVLGRVRSSARQAECASNLRQIGITLLTHANDNRGVTIAASVLRTNPDGSTSSRSWGEEIAAWDGTLHLFATRAKGGGYFGVWRCPENREQLIAPMGQNTTDGEISGSYGINGWNNNTQVSENRFTSVPLSRMANPAKLYAVWDKAGFRHEIFRTDGEGNLPNDIYAGIPNTLNRSRYVHNGKINMLFADGHVETLAGPVAARGSRVASAPADRAAGWTNGVHYYAN